MCRLTVQANSETFSEIAQIPAKLGLVPYLLSFPVAATISIAVHELGHLWVGVLAGFDVSSVRIGALETYLSGRSWRFRLRLGLASFLSGEILFAPTTIRSRWAWAVSCLAGPIASLALLLLAVRSQTAILQPIALTESQGATTWLGVLRVEVAFSCALLLATSLFPTRNAFLPNDFYHIRAALQGEGSWERWRACLGALYQNWVGDRPREWPEEIVSSLVAKNDGTIAELRALMLAVYAIGDRRQGDRLVAPIERALQLSTRFERFELLAELAFWQATSSSSLDGSKQTLMVAEHRCSSESIAVLKARELLNARVGVTTSDSKIQAVLHAVEAEIQQGRGGIGLAEQAWLLQLLA